MRSIVFSLFFIFAFEATHANTSFLENLADWSAIELEKQSSFEARKQVLERTQEILAKKIETDSDESLMSLNAEDPKIENLRTLLEFQGYLDLIAESAMKVSCKDTMLNLKNSAISPINEVNKASHLKELELALKIQRSLCKSHR